MYKYIYGEPKSVSSTSTSMPTSSRTSLGSIGGGGGGESKYTPSLHEIPGGISETRCFN